MYKKITNLTSSNKVNRGAINTGATPVGGTLKEMIKAQKKVAGINQEPSRNKRWNKKDFLLVALFIDQNLTYYESKAA